MPRTMVPDEYASVILLSGIHLGLDAQVAFDAGDGVDNESLCHDVLLLVPSQASASASVSK